MVRLFPTALFAAVLAAALLCARGASAGYTHYWMWHAPPEPVALGHCLDDMMRIVDARPDLVADDHDRTGAAAVFRGTGTFRWDGGPTVPNIYFNGIGQSAYEPFVFPLASDDDPSFTFVKTEYRPYDEVVVACLIVARDHFPGDVLEIRSDGLWDEEWRPGRALYEKVLGRSAQDPLSPGVYGPDGQAPGQEGEPPGSTDSLGKNLLISAAVFLALGAIYWLTKRP